MSTAPNFDVDTIKIIAEASAKATAQELLPALREEVKNIIDAKFREHFGDMSASSHLIEHSRLSTLLKVYDETRSGVIKKLIGAAIMVIFGAAAAWLAFKGGAAPA